MSDTVQDKLLIRCRPPCEGVEPHAPKALPLAD